MVIELANPNAETGKPNTMVIVAQAPTIVFRAFTGDVPGEEREVTPADGDYAGALTRHLELLATAGFSEV